MSQQVIKAIIVFISPNYLLVSYNKNMCIASKVKILPYGVHKLSIEHAEFEAEPLKFE